MGIDLKPVELDAETRLELASMVYRRWTEAYNAMKAAKAAAWDPKVCPKGDWPLFHDAQTKTAQKELDLATRLKDGVCKYSPLMDWGVTAMGAMG